MLYLTEKLVSYLHISQIEVFVLTPKSQKEKNLVLKHYKLINITDHFEKLSATSYHGLLLLSTSVFAKLAPCPL